jgi:hypothetical protein
MHGSNAGQLARRPRRNQRLRLVAVVAEVSLVQGRQPDVARRRLTGMLLLLLESIWRINVMITVWATYFDRLLSK